MSEIGQKIIEATREAAFARPDFTYTGECAYVENGEPGCLIGHALWNLGLIDASFQRALSNELGVGACLDELSIKVDDDEYEWLSAAQNWQDLNHPWGKAVAHADEESTDAA